jgi:peptide/nickel transport system substrate-binding protein
MSASIPAKERDARQFGDLLDQVLSGRLNRRQVMTRAAALGLSAASIATLAAAAGGAVSPILDPAALHDETPKTGGILKAGFQADPSALDPHQQTLTAIWHVIEHIYNRLVTINPDLTVGPELAEAMPTISEDGLTYTFKLRQGVMFHPPVSRPLVASDVVFSFERWRAPESAAASDLISVDTITAPDDSTVVITLKQPDASILPILAGSSAIVLAPETIEANGDLSQTAVGTGPFRFVEYVPNTRVVLEKNPEYWEEGLPYLDGIEITFVSEDTQRTNAVLTGEVDFVEYAPLRDIDQLEGDDSIALAGDANMNIRFLAFNLTKPPLDNLLVRQAVAKAIDRTTVHVPGTFGHGTPVVGLFPPTYWAALNEEIPAPDVEGAKALLAEAGFADGFETSITSWSQYSFLSQPALVVQEQLEQIGIRAELNLVETATMIEVVHSADPALRTYELAVTGTSGHIDPGELLQYFKTDASSNLASYSNPQVDELIDQGIAETDVSARTEIYLEIQRILLEDLPWVNLFVANQYEAMRSHVKGYVHIATGSNVALKQTWLDQ